uniref:Growth hormone receptor n=1 Tax=Andrias davidianus TaxID=141262 RepID=A0A1C8DRE1_ANDDA|nr:growth hormone receptor [Andrias davidianus]
MAFWLLLFTLALVCSNVSLFTSEVSSGEPGFDCRSPDQETFTCLWTYGDFHNLTGHVNLMYMLRKDMIWRECPDYKSAGENSCYFNSSYTNIWTEYCLKLEHENTTLHEKCINVEDIVKPYPPIGLNWTLMNFSLTCIYADIRVTWQPPPSADIKKGWITLIYELQFKEVNATIWTQMDPVFVTVLPVYSLKIEKDYEMRVRCRPHASGSFGEFSETLYVSFADFYVVQDHDEPKFPWLFFVIFGTFGGAVVLLLILFSKQKRIKMLILPPVPVPKIKGIDPELIKKGKLDEVNSILACHESYKPQMYNDDSWVEFIELDMDDPDEKTEGLDTDRLLAEDHLKSNCLGVKDDDSGRASCCEPDIPETDFSVSDTCDGTSDIVQSQKLSENEDLMCLDQKENDESLSSSNAPTSKQLSSMMKSDDMKSSPLLICGMEKGSPPFNMQMSNLSSKTNMDFYALVSDITPAGRLLLSPGQKNKIENEYCREIFLQRQPIFNMDSAYICESDAVTFCPVSSSEQEEPHVQQSFNEDAYFNTESLTTNAMSSGEADGGSSAEMPVPEYTSIHIINSPQSMVLNAAVLPEKDFIASCGYMTPDQVNKVMP